MQFRQSVRSCRPLVGAWATRACHTEGQSHLAVPGRCRVAIFSGIPLLQSIGDLSRRHQPWEKSVSMTSSTPSVAALLRRHRAFWEMDDVDEPLLRIGEYRRPAPLPDPPNSLQLADDVFVADGDLIRPQAVDAAFRAGARAPDGPVSGSFVSAVRPGGLCWTEAALGCPIRWRSNSIWAEPFLDDLEELAELQLSAEWVRKLVEMTQILVERAAGNCPSAQPLLRGPIDMAASALGDEKLCWLMLEQPDRMRRFLEICTDVFLGVAHAWQETAPPFEGGYSIYGIWAPGTATRIQCDNAAIMSPRLLRDFLQPCDERICAAFEYPLMHTHSCFIDIATGPLLELEGLRAIQVTLDYPGGPPVNDLLPALRAINRQKPLIVTGALSESELQLLRAELSPRGLSLQLNVHA